jgi:hypothetical protein
VTTPITAAATVGQDPPPCEFASLHSRATGSLRIMVPNEDERKAAKSPLRQAPAHARPRQAAHPRRLGPTAPSADQARDLLEIVEDRYDKGSSIAGTT